MFPANGVADQAKRAERRLSGEQIVPEFRQSAEKLNRNGRKEKDYLVVS
jgi:hypothetical protein